MAKRFNVVVPRKYEVNGEEKTAWGTVGTLVYFGQNKDGEEGFALELNMFPETKFKIFPIKPRQEKNNDDEI